MRLREMVHYICSKTHVCRVVGHCGEFGLSNAAANGADFEVITSPASTAYPMDAFDNQRSATHVGKAHRASLPYSTRTLKDCCTTFSKRRSGSWCCWVQFLVRRSGFSKLPFYKEDGFDWRFFDA